MCKYIYMHRHILEWVAVLKLLAQTVGYLVIEMPFQNTSKVRIYRRKIPQTTNLQIILCINYLAEVVATKNFAHTLNH